MLEGKRFCLITPDGEKHHIEDCAICGDGTLMINTWYIDADGYKQLRWKAAPANTEFCDAN